MRSAYIFSRLGFGEKKLYSGCVRERSRNELGVEGVWRFVVGDAFRTNNTRYRKMRDAALSTCPRIQERIDVKNKRNQRRRNRI